MKTIAYRRNSLILLYGICLFVGVQLAIDSATKAGRESVAILAYPLVLVSAVMLVALLLTPWRAIRMSAGNRLLLSFGRKVDLRDISSVSFHRKSGRGFQYSHGTVIIYALQGTYRVRFVADCEAVARYLQELVLEAKVQS